MECGFRSHLAGNTCVLLQTEDRRGTTFTVRSPCRFFFMLSLSPSLPVSVLLALVPPFSNASLYEIRCLSLSHRVLYAVHSPWLGHVSLMPLKETDRVILLSALGCNKPERSLPQMHACMLLCAAAWFR